MINRIINMSPQGSLGSGIISILAARQGNLMENWQRGYWTKSRKKSSPPQPAVKEAEQQEPEAEESGTQESTYPAVQNAEEKRPAAPAAEKGASAFSRQELHRAVVMSTILGPPVCRKRKRYEGNTHRR